MSEFGEIAISLQGLIMQMNFDNYQKNVKVEEKHR